MWVILVVVGLILYLVLTADDDIGPRNPIFTPTKSISDLVTAIRLWVLPTKVVSVIDYNKYIRSVQWYNNPNRLITLHRDKHQCRMCGSPDDCEVHHIHYNTLGNEKAEALCTLCKKCHEVTHRVAGKGAGYYPPLNHKGIQ